MAGPYTPETMYVTLEGSIVQEVTYVSDEPATVVDEDYYDTEYWRNLFNAGELGRQINQDKATGIIVGTSDSAPTSTTFGTGASVSGAYVSGSNISGPQYTYQTKIVYPSNVDTYMEADDRMQTPPTPPRPLAKSRSKIVFPRHKSIAPNPVVVLAPVWFWADEVIGYSASRPSLLGYS